MKQDNLAFGEASLGFAFILKDSKDLNDITVKYRATVSQRGVYLCLC